MKLFTIIKIFSIVTIGVLLGGCKTLKYEIGRDTVTYFGDGRYQILRGVGDNSLFDMQTDQELAQDVTNWTSKANLVGIVGRKPTEPLRKQDFHFHILILHLSSGKSKWYDDKTKIPEEYGSLVKRFSIPLK